MHNNDNHKGMMWMMVLCCALPLALLFFGGSALFSGGYLPKVLIGAVAVACVWMMFKGHGDSDNNNGAITSGESKTEDTHKNTDGCH